MRWIAKVKVVYSMVIVETSGITLIRAQKDEEQSVSSFRLFQLPLTHMSSSTLQDRRSEHVLAESLHDAK